MCSGFTRARVEPAEDLFVADDLPVGVAVLGRAADDVLLVDTPGLLGEHPHEVTPAAGADEDPERVRLQQVEQVQHRPIHQLDVRDPELGLLAGSWVATPCMNAGSRSINALYGCCSASDGSAFTSAAQ